MANSNSSSNCAVSVVIPMYNTEEYIGECLTSLVNQTFQDFEVIIADDCSTDNSCVVAQNFSSHFRNRLKLGKLSVNSGYPSIPRNFALANARGKYVYFLDSDDLLSETALEELYNVAEKFNADVVHVEKYIIFSGDGKDAELQSFQAGGLVTEPTLETFDICERVTGFVQKKFLWWACNKLFRRQFLCDNKITFPKTTTFEDFVFAFKCLVAAKNYVRVPFASYYYRIREDSLSHKASCAVPQFMEDTMNVVKSTDDFMLGKKFFADNPEYRYMLIDFFMQIQLESFAKSIFLSGNNSLGELYDFLYKEIFSRTTQEHAAFTSYLFIAMNVFKLYTIQQANELAKFKANS